MDYIIPEIFHLLGSIHSSTPSVESRKLCNRTTQQLDRVRRNPKRAFLRSSYTVWMLFSFVAGLLPSEKLIFFSKNRINAVGSSLESIPINFSNAKSGYATVFAIFYLTSLVAPILFNFVLVAQQLSIQVALT